jgi:hypothetical protein
MGAWARVRNWGFGRKKDSARRHVVTGGAKDAKDREVIAIGSFLC